MLAGIALGSNVGDRLAHLHAARDRLGALHEGSKGGFRVSSIYETEPVGCGPEAEAFYNAVVMLETSLAPHALLDAAQSIEQALGRPTRRPKNAPRTIDVDLLFLGDTVLSDERLELPHPRLLQRRFVLTPLAEIWPEGRLPGEAHSFSDALNRLESDEAIPERLALPDWR
ncbi:MAG: 2-amino-4-hydroxy-6-hydroxymethyldihydropteridine diphosphokinase [Verrucomicrobiae bacterium]|nr:2-amino-4-hydroxy-6-hydroxymethyldihydropteridine diphosphokinase [Verrucomicrobiae bacterium]